VGRDLPGAIPAGDLYVRLEQGPGGRSNQLEGDFVFDIETFSTKYAVAYSAAQDIEALLLRYPHVVRLDDRQVVFDSVDQNTAPHEIFWDDDSVHRLLATYVITARR
jgi:hypothetical protein